jgi:pyruvate dehydrogenase E2 component (dihydrolipoamide acetyltransferase)
MAIELTMPALSPTMEKGALAKWLISEGDQVKAGDLIAEIETDKATMEIEAPAAGRIASLRILEGSADVAVGTVIALLTEDSDAAPMPTIAALAFATAKVKSSQTPRELVPSQPAPKETAPRNQKFPADRIAVSPLALRIAGAVGINLDIIVGTGPNGRIVLADLGLEKHAQPKQPIPSRGRVDITAALPAGVPLQTIKLSSMRRTIARRLTQSKQTVPHFYLNVRCNIDPLIRLRQDLNAVLAKQDIKLSVNDLFIKAMALALVEVPDANVQFGDDEMHRFSRVDISMAVAIDGGLITPIIRDVASLSLSAIASQSKAIAAKARDGKLLPEDYQGGTASISNLGMFGIDEMFPVINPPQALILGIGAGVEQPWKVNGEIDLATIMAATGSFDHRVIDGAVAAQFMGAFRQLVEQPYLIAV